MINNINHHIGAERTWNQSLVSGNSYRKSELCKAKDFRASWYKKWCIELGEEPRFHRKQWEFVYILQSLSERGCIGEGKKGLVFAVGTEPLPSILAKLGCEILATDIHTERGTELGWTNGEQLCFGVESLNKRCLCNDAIFYKRVRYTPVDMNHIPAGLKNFDFNWSSCSFEHLGSIEKGLHFLSEQLKTLKPGGWAVHTTEYNISSDDATLDNNDSTVVFRKKDIDRIVKKLRKEGHFVEELDYSLGALPEDFHVDTFPHKQDIHIRLQLNEYVVTSIGLIIQKKRGLFGMFNGKRKR